MATSKKAKEAPVEETEHEEVEAKAEKKPKRAAKPAKDPIEERNAKRSFMRNLIADKVNEVARRQNYLPTSLDVMPSMSTGSLALDYIMAGGIRPGFYVSAGEEQSGKTTSQLVTLASCIKEDVAEITFADAEGSTGNARNYVTNIVNINNGTEFRPADVFGREDKKTGEWINPPIFRYRNDAVAEHFFDFAVGALNEMPDKRFARGEWWYVFKNTVPNKAAYGKYADKAMSRHGDGIWVPCEEGGKLQAVLFIDSVPALCPAARTEEDNNKSIGLLARILSDNLPRLKGLLQSKMVAVFATNQLRDNINVRAGYGPPKKEAGGNALRYFSDVRLMHSRRVTGYPLWGKLDSVEGVQGKVELERSVLKKGDDTYFYVNIKFAKNKLSSSTRSTWARIWMSDPTNEAFGFDPFFDTMQYLYNSGQLVGRGRGSLKLLLHTKPTGEIVETKVVDWFDMKRWILGDRETKEAIAEKYGVPVVDLRAHCFKQVKHGYAEKLFNRMVDEGLLVEDVPDVSEDDDLGEVI